MPSSRALHGEACYDVEYLVTDAQGRDRVLLMNAIPLRAEGEVQGAVFAQMDITERRQAEEALRRANEQLLEADRQKTRFLAVLSHELRNPLAAIKNSLHVLHRVAPDGEQAGRAKAIIERQASHLARLIDDLLDVTRIVSGKFRLEPSRFDLAELLRRTADDHRTLFTSGGIDFEVGVSSGPFWIDGDETRIAQAAGNLLGNAAKFTGRGGRVALILESDAAGQNAVIRVRDTGAGLPHDLLPKLFQPFVQADDTLARTNSGLGLGLAIVKSVVDLHGGSVEAHSEGPGSGAEFVIRIPIEGVTAPAPDGCERAFEPPPPRRVLVIEDNVDAADSLREVLELGGHEVVVAHKGSEGIEAARAFEPDLVLCDVGLPDMSGYDVAQAFRAEEKLREVGLVALTGYAQPEDLVRAKEAGFDGHVAKPPDLTKIEELLRHLPGRR